ncbi:MAG: MBL fold metallo-hydrolase [Lachnospiraceae bacterium]|nr:MBL fold metallo-hydrolase [Lachnospiraceae bacterium]
MDNLDIKINTHSSIKITEGGKKFYFDPFELRGRFCDADYIFITHDHYDHLDPKSIQNVMNDKTKFICPTKVAKTLISDAGIRDSAKIIKLNPFDKIELEENIRVETLPAYNINKQFHQKVFEWLSYILDVNGKRFYVAGDTDATDEAREVKCDVALVPIGGTYTMDYEQASKLVNIIKPKVAIPTHYGNVVGEYELGKKFVALVDKSIEVKEIIEKEIRINNRRGEENEVIF